MAFILHGSCLHTHAHNHNHSHEHHSHSKDHKNYEILLQKDNNPVNNNEDHHHHHNDTSSNRGNNFLNSSDSINSSTYYLTPNQSQNHSHSNERMKSILLNSTATTFEEEKLNSYNTDLSNVSSVFVKNVEKPETSRKNINIQAAVIHVIGDFIQSVGVFLAAIIIKIYPEAKIVDPLCTFLFSIVVMLTTVRIMKESILVILDGVPGSFDLGQLNVALGAIPGVQSVHYLNVWSVSVDWNVMSVHLVVDAYANCDEILSTASSLAKTEFNLKHSTIQIEREQQHNMLSIDRHTSNSIDITESAINFV